MTTEKMISNICKKEYKFFLSKPNVIGVALGYKIINGFYTCRKCITVFVTKKLSSNKLFNSEVIPTYYKGFVTDVKQCGMFTCDALNQRIRPVLGGYSAGNILRQNYGTAGCLVADKYLYVLSNNHVFALNNTLPLESAIVQPGVADGGKIEKDAIGHLQRYIPIKFIEVGSIPENIVDCALCKVISRSFVSPKISFVGIPLGTTRARLNENVKKVGRTTEMTTGVVNYLSATCNIACSGVGKRALFKDQIVTSKMGDSGDSGALLLNEDNYAIGLYFSSGNDVGLFNPIQEVLNSLKIKLVIA